MSESELNFCPFYTAYYENDFGNYLPAYLTQSPDIASKIDCSVVRASDYEQILQKLESAEARADKAETAIREAREQRPYGWDSSGDLVYHLDAAIKSPAPIPLYASPVPAMPIPKGWKLVRTTAEEDKAIKDFQLNFGLQPQSEVKQS